MQDIDIIYPGFENRTDVVNRYKMILPAMGEFKGRSIIDIGCANGWFILQFVSAGMRYGVGIDTDGGCLAKANHLKDDLVLNAEFFDSVSHVDEKQFDYCLYLDLHFHSQSYLPWIKRHCDVLFVSPAQEGNTRNIQLEEELMDHFGNFTLIGDTGYNGRNLYKVVINE